MWFLMLPGFGVSDAHPDRVSAGLAHEAANSLGVAEGSQLFRFVLRKPLTAYRAGWAIALSTLLVTVAAGVGIRVVDRSEFDNVWIGLWWAVQTVTTVGYGDIVPHNPRGRVIGAALMLAGIAFLTVLTAMITAALVESLRRRYEVAAGEHLDSKLDEVTDRLERLEALLRERT
jgi:voltage-gated potassium channel